MEQAIKARVDSARAFNNDGWRNNIFYRPISPIYSLLRKSDITGKAVLEIGCGDLFHSYGLIREAKSYVGVDISDLAISKARDDIEETISARDKLLGIEIIDKFRIETSERFANYKSKMALLDSPANEIELAPQSIEGVISIDTMPMLGESFPEAIRRISVAMTPGGAINFNMVHTDWYLDDKGKDGSRFTLMGHGEIIERTWSGLSAIAFSEDGITKALMEVGMKTSDIRLFTEKDENDLVPAQTRILLNANRCYEEPEITKPGVVKFMMVRAVKE